MISIKATAVHFLQDHHGYTDAYYRKKPKKNRHTNIHSGGEGGMNTVQAICSIRHKLQKLRMDFLRNYK